MRALFDTSVLVAALVASHPQHSVCVIRLNQVLSQEIEGLISTHTLAELYSVLTSDRPHHPTTHPPTETGTFGRHEIALFYSPTFSSRRPQRSVARFHDSG